VARAGGGEREDVDGSEGHTDLKAEAAAEELPIRSLAGGGAPADGADRSED